MKSDRHNSINDEDTNAKVDSTKEENDNILEDKSPSLEAVPEEKSKKATKMPPKPEEPRTKGSKAQKWKERMAKAKQRSSDPEASLSSSPSTTTKSPSSDQHGGVSCKICGVEKEKDQFSKSQLKRGTNKCKECVSKIEG